MDTSKATPELFAALSKAQAEVENATKGSVNPHFKSRYADLAEVLNTARPVFAKHGLCILQSTAFDGSLVHVETVIGHSSGGLICSTASCVPAKSDAQGIGSATTYLRRYGAAAMCGIAQEDDDGNAAAHNKPAESVKAKTDKFAQIADYIKDGINRDDPSAVIEVWADLPEDDKKALWVAETRGGYFSQSQKQYIRTAMDTLRPREEAA